MPNTPKRATQSEPARKRKQRKPVALEAASETPSRSGRRGFGTPPKPAALAALVEAIDRLAPSIPFAVGVSGGSDSLSLMHASAAWAQAKGAMPPTVLTVDHGLRPGSASEARQVKAWAEAMGLPHRTLVWRDEKPASGLAAAARHARYGLMGTWCLGHGARSLLVGHTRDDVAETMLMRLVRGSGLDGLSAIAERLTIELPAGDIELLRPLLKFGRVELMRFLEKSGRSWVGDPSNEDERFERVQVRRALEALGEIGFGTTNIALAARRLGEARSFVDDLEASAFEAAVVLYPEGYAVLCRDVLAHLPTFTQRRLIDDLMRTIAPRAYGARTEDVERLISDLVRHSHRTLGGCRFLVRGDKIEVVRELDQLLKICTALRPGETALWDRFRVSLAKGAKGEGVVRALGADGAKAVAVANAGAKERLADYPAHIKHSFAALFSAGRPVAVPAVGYSDPASGALARDFSATFLGRRPQSSVLRIRGIPPLPAEWLNET